LFACFAISGRIISSAKKYIFQKKPHSFKFLKEGLEGQKMLAGRGLATPALWEPKASLVMQLILVILHRLPNTKTALL
jgi:hypothetical protein